MYICLYLGKGRGDNVMYDKKDMYEKFIECKNSFNLNYNNLLEEVEHCDKKELLAMFGARYYIDLMQGKSSSEISSALLEYIAGVCISSGNIGNKNVDKAIYKKINYLCEQLADNQLIINMYASINEEDDNETVSKKLFLGEMKNSYSFTRGYSWYRFIEEENIKKIFAGFETKIIQVIGFAPAEVYVLADAYAKLLFDRIRSVALQKVLCEPDELQDYDIFSFIGDNYYDLMSITYNELYEKCNELSRKHFDAIIEFFSCKLSNTELYEKVKYFTDNNFFSMHPIINDDNKLLIINHQLLLWNLRECIEEAIKKDNKLWNDYDKNHKAKFLEEKSSKLIKNILPQCTIYSSLYYQPAGEETACELDLLAVYDKIVILVEAKSGIYSRPAKRGGLKRPEKVVDKNIEFAFVQADRTRAYINNNIEAKFYTDANLRKEAVTLKSGDIADVFIINTTLDYYAELGVDLYKLKKYDIYKREEFPWTVCISDLEVIADFMDFPNQFLYYMYLRRTINNTLSEKNGAILLYELDLLAMYKTENTEKFWSYDIGGNEKIILENGIILSSKDYSNYFKDFYEKYYEKKEKPEIEKKVYNRRFLQMCRQLEEYNTKGVSFFILRFLDLDLDDQNRLLEEIDKSCERTRKNNKIHSVSIKRMPQHFLSEPFGLVVYTSYKKDRNEVERLACLSGEIQQGQTGITHWITLCIFLDDDRHFINQFYFYSGSDELTEKLRSIISHIPVTAPVKVYPNDPCPCGSGMKYKKCCGK